MNLLNLEKNICKTGILGKINLGKYGWENYDLEILGNKAFIHSKKDNFAFRMIHISSKQASKPSIIDALIGFVENETGNGKVNV